MVLHWVVFKTNVLSCVILIWQHTFGQSSDNVITWGHYMFFSVIVVKGPNHLLLKFHSWISQSKHEHSSIKGHTCRNFNLWRHAINEVNYRTPAIPPSGICGKPILLETFVSLEKKVCVTYICRIWQASKNIFPRGNDPSAPAGMYCMYYSVLTE